MTQLPRRDNPRQPHHVCFARLHADYHHEYALPPGGSLPATLTVNRSLLRTVGAQLRPYRGRWGDPTRHLAKHYNPPAIKARIDALFDLLLDDLLDLLDLLHEAMPFDPSVARFRRAATELEAEVKRLDETRYYALPVLMTYTYEVALIAHALPGNPLPAQILAYFSAFFVYPVTDTSSFELRLVYEGEVADSNGSYPWHVLSAIRLGRSRRYVCPVDGAREALFLERAHSVTVFDRSAHPVNSQSQRVCALSII